MCNTTEYRLNTAKSYERRLLEENCVLSEQEYIDMAVFIYDVMYVIHDEDVHTEVYKLCNEVLKPLVQSKIPDRLKSGVHKTEHNTTVFGEEIYIADGRPTHTIWVSHNPDTCKNKKKGGALLHMREGKLWCVACETLVDLRTTEEVKL